VEPAAPSPRSLRILLVAGSSARTDAVEAALARDLGSDAAIARVAEAPPDLAGLDVAVVVRTDPGPVLEQLGGLPAVLVADGVPAEGCAGLVRLGARMALSAACATCEREPNLAWSVRWAAEHGRRARELETEHARDLRAALRDPLTGLPNVELYRERLRQLVAQGRRTGKEFALFFLDLDGFKRVNDALGHAAGDQLLGDVARRLSADLRETDLVARRGGDEFVVLLDAVGQPADAARLARKLLRRVSGPSVVESTVLRVRASLGIALFPTDGVDEASLERGADLAMYAAKILGGNRCCFAGGAPAAM
jgi:diguanylate cyclase (GGDEF)-like protein